MASETHGKRATGIGERPDDKWATPLCSDCHLDGPQAQHRGSERAFWSRVGVDPFAVAKRLYALYKRKAPPAAVGAKRSRPGRAKKTAANPASRNPRKWPSRKMQSASKWPVGRKFGRKS